ncbi:hypothetical protein JCM17380_13130 [Desulfosporosinus burensis]
MKNKITFRLYQIDKDLPDDVIDGYLYLETTDDIMPGIYRFVWESQEDADLDRLYSKYTKAERPNKHVARSIDVSDVIEIQDDQGITFFIADRFDLTEIEFDKSQVPNEMGFQKMYVNMDSEMKRVLCTDWSAKAVIEILVKRLGKSRRIVALMFHQSETYKHMLADKTGLCERPYQIVDDFEKEIKELKE